MTAATEIPALVAAWNACARAGDVEGCMAFFAEDGRFMPPNAPAAVGKAAVRETWTGLLGLPNLHVAFGPTVVESGASDDVAYEIGTWELAFDTEAGRHADHGKYVVVWRKRGGQWQVMADCFNSDVPPPG